MRIFFSSLLILAHVLCLTFPVVARDSGGTLDTDHVNNQVFQSSYDTESRSWTSVLMGNLQNAYLPPNVRLMNLAQTMMMPKKQSPSDFWEEVMKYEKVLEEYVPRLLESAADYFKSTMFTDITSSMHNIVLSTTTFRENIQNALDSHNITVDTLTNELELSFMAIVQDWENIPPPSKAPGHAEREEMVEKILDDTERTLIELATRYNIDPKVVASYLDVLKSEIRTLVVAVGDINEQHPELLPSLAFSVAALLIPESWILRPFLSMFGFGPTGPIKGSVAAWIQSRFWGAAVESGSWFSWLQAAAMGRIPQWAGSVIKVPLAIVIGLLGMLLPCFRHQ